MTVSKSCPRGPTSRTARSPRRRRALPPLQSLGGSLHYRGSNGGTRVHRDPSRLCRQQLPRAGSAESRKSGRSPRGCSVSSLLLLLRLRVVCVPARLCVCARVCVCPDTHVPPTHACSYLLAEAAVGAMAAKDAAPDDQHPHGGTAALSPASRMAIEGQEAGQPLSLMLITKQPLS